MKTNYFLQEHEQNTQPTRSTNVASIFLQQKIFNRTVTVVQQISTFYRNFVKDKKEHKSISISKGLC